MTNPLISVIIPVYNTEKYLERCVRSIFAQSYPHWELILVDDGSPDGSERIIEHLKQSDSRVQSVRHKRNLGLFQARLTGCAHASGKYITFVDSDDHVSADWLERLVIRAEEACADITVGEWCFDTAGKDKTYFALDHFRRRDYHLEGPGVLRAFMQTQGRNYSWTILWNKLYTRALWKHCHPVMQCFAQKHGHMIMWEDIAFSACLWANAHRVVNVHGGNYFYFRHSDAATRMTADAGRGRKYIHDASSAMALMEQVLSESGRYREFEQDYLSWKRYGMSTVYNDLVNQLGLLELKDEILRQFDCEESDYRWPCSHIYAFRFPLLGTPDGSGLRFSNFLVMIREIFLGLLRLLRYQIKKR